MTIDSPTRGIDPATAAKAVHSGTEREVPSPARGSNTNNLVELFADSPFAGLNMDFERDKDTGREIKL